MAFLKFKGKGIFTGSEMLDEKQVLVTDEKGTIREIVAVENAGADVQTVEGMLCPGFINTHCHLELSHMKGAIAPGSGMVPFLLQVMGNRFKTIDNLQQAMTDAENEMRQNGIVAVGDICNTADSIAVKQNSPLYYHNFVEVSGFVPATAGFRLGTAQQVAQQFEAVFPKRQVSITPHAPYSVSPELFQHINALPGNDLLTLHNQESSDENLFFTQKESAFLQLFDRIGVNIDFYNPPAKNSLPAVCGVMDLPRKQWLLVHNCLTTAEDIAESCLPDTTAFFCLCPGANLYIGNPLPNIPMLQSQPQRICLGTDSLASNQQLSMLAEMRLLQQHFPQVALTDLLQWATLNGAGALQIADRFGSFENGKQPGVLVIQNLEKNVIGHKTKVKRLI